MVVGRLEAFFSPDLDEAARSRLRLPEESQRGHLSGASIVRVGVFRRVGAFDESFRFVPDIDWFMRATESGVRTQFLPDVVVRRRIHGGNMSRTMKKESGELLRILKASLDHRRAAMKRPSE
jgi:GT2 family glycosyltransferase